MINNLEKSFKQNEKGLKYILTAPTDYKKGESLPLIVFLHGAGERGDDLELLRLTEFQNTCQKIRTTLA